MTSEAAGPGADGEPASAAGRDRDREKPIHAAPPWRGAIGGPEEGPYPMRFEVEYPERLNRWKTLLRIFLLIPAAVLLLILSWVRTIVVPVGWIAVFLSRSYPPWLFAALTGYLGFEARVGAYVALLTDRYPSFEAAGSPVLLEYDVPPAGQLSRWRVSIWKLILLIPQWIVGYAFGAAWLVLVVIAWLAILVTGRYPRGMFDFVVGVHRWWYRVIGYAASLNDRYPPFALAADAGPAERSTTVIVGVIGGLLTATVMGLGITFVVFGTQPDNVELRYADLLEGDVPEGITYGRSIDDIRLVAVRLIRGYDEGPADEITGILEPGPGERLVGFEWLIGVSRGKAEIEADDARLKVRLGDGDTKTFDAELTIIDGRTAPREIEDQQLASVLAVFVIPDDAQPIELRFRPEFARVGGIRYTFIE